MSQHDKIVQVVFNTPKIIQGLTLCERAAQQFAAAQLKEIKESDHELSEEHEQHLKDLRMLPAVLLHAAMDLYLEELEKLNNLQPEKEDNT